MQCFVGSFHVWGSQYLDEGVIIPHVWEPIVTSWDWLLLCWTGGLSTHAVNSRIGKDSTEKDAWICNFLGSTHWNLDQGPPFPAMFTLPDKIVNWIQQIWGTLCLTKGISQVSPSQGRCQGRRSHGIVSHQRQQCWRGKKTPNMWLDWHQQNKDQNDVNRAAGNVGSVDTCAGRISSRQEGGGSRPRKIFYVAPYVHVSIKQ